MPEGVFAPPLNRVKLKGGVQRDRTSNNENGEELQKYLGNQHDRIYN